MTLKTARNILLEDISTMGLEEIQKHRVRILDALRHCEGKFGMGFAVREGFFKILESDSATGFVPSDLWLAHNLDWKLREVMKKEAELFAKA